MAGGGGLRQAPEGAGQGLPGVAHPAAGHAQGGGELGEGHVVQEHVLPGPEHVGGEEHLVPQVTALEVLQNVLAGEEPGDVYRAPEEVVFHRHQVDS